MTNTGIGTYFLRIFITGVQEPMVFEVDEETSDRVSRNIQERPGSFCWFSTLDGRDIAFALDGIDLVNFLWEPGRALPVENEESGENSVLIHFTGRVEAYEARIEEAWEAHDLFWYLEMGSYEDDPFLWFVDEDGERVVLDARKVFLVEASTSFLAEGRRQTEAQDEGVDGERGKESSGR